MMRRFACAVTTLALLMPITAQAEWHEREAAIMGTRIAVELWHEDAGQAEAAIDAVMAEMHRIDELMSVYKPDQSGVASQSRCRDRARQGRCRTGRAHREGAGILRTFRWRIRHHIRKCRIPVRLSRAPPSQRIPDPGGPAGDQLAPCRRRSGGLDRPVHAARRADRPRRNRQGPCGGQLPAFPARPRNPECAASPPGATPG